MKSALEINMQLAPEWQEYELCRSTYALEMQAL